MGQKVCELKKNKNEEQAQTTYSLLVDQLEMKKKIGGTGQPRK